MKFYSQERVAIFIDGANLYAAARSLGFDIDYKRLLEVFSSQCNLVRALYYTALIEDQEYSPIRPLVDWLDYNGYTMVTKPIREYTDSQGRRKTKGSIDIDLTIDAMMVGPYMYDNSISRSCSCSNRIGPYNNHLPSSYNKLHSTRQVSSQALLLLVRGDD